MRCRSGRHEWIDPASAIRCCSGQYRRELREIRDTEGTEPDGRTYLSDPELRGLVFVWVRTQTQRSSGLQ